MEQARAFWPKVDTKRLLDLPNKDWDLEPNLRFYFITTKLHRGEHVAFVGR